MFTSLKSLPPIGRLAVPVLLATIAAALIAAFLVEPPSSGLKQKGAQSSPNTAQGVLDGRGDTGPTRSDVMPFGGSTDSDVASEPAGDAVSGPGYVDEAAPSTVVAKEAASGGTIVGSAPANMGLKMIQTADLEVRFKKGKLDSGYRQAILAAESVGGFVVSSNISEDTRTKSRSATLTLRVPNSKFNSVLDRLGERGKVISLTVSSQDVTEEYVDTRSRLRHDQAVEARLLQLLGKANTVSDALVIQDRLNDIQQQIEVEKGRINYLDKLTAMATIQITMGEGKAPARATSDDWGVQDAFDTAAHRFVGNINRAIVSTGGALPALLTLLVFLVVGRTSWRRRQRRLAQVVAPAAGASHPEVGTDSGK